MTNETHIKNGLSIYLGVTGALLTSVVIISGVTYLMNKDAIDLAFLGINEYVQRQKRLIAELEKNKK